MTQLQYWKDKPDACWHGGMKQIWRHRRASSLKLRRLRLWRTCAWKYRRYDYGMSVEEKEKRGEKEKWEKEGEKEHEIKKEEEERSTRLSTLRPDGALAHPSAVTLFVARPELPSEVQVTKYFSRIIIKYNFNHIDDRILILLSFSLSHWFVCLLNFQPYFCDICMYFNIILI